MLVPWAAKHVASGHQHNLDVGPRDPLAVLCGVEVGQEMVGTVKVAGVVVGVEDLRRIAQLCCTTKHADLVQLQKKLEQTPVVIV